MTPDNIAPKPDYQQDRIANAAYAIHKRYSGKEWDELEEGTREIYLLDAEAALKAADAVPRPTQPGVMSAEELVTKFWHGCDFRQTIELVEKRDEAIRIHVIDGCADYAQKHGSTYRDRVISDNIRALKSKAEKI